MSNEKKRQEGKNDPKNEIRQIIIGMKALENERTKIR